MGVSAVMKAPAVHHGSSAEATVDSHNFTHMLEAPHQLRLAVPSDLCLCQLGMPGDERISQVPPEDKEGC